MVAIKIQFVLELASVNDRLGSLEGLLIYCFEFVQEVNEEEIVLECVFVLVCLDVKKGEEAVYVAAALLAVIVSAVDADNGSRAYLLPLEV